MNQLFSILRFETNRMRENPVLSNQKNGQTMSNLSNLVIFTWGPLIASNATHGWFCAESYWEYPHPCTVEARKTTCESQTKYSKIERTSRWLMFTLHHLAIFHITQAPPACNYWKAAKDNPMFDLFHLQWSKLDPTDSVCTAWNWETGITELRWQSESHCDEGLAKNHMQQARSCKPHPGYKVLHNFESDTFWYSLRLSTNPEAPPAGVDDMTPKWSILVWWRQHLDWQVVKATKKPWFWCASSN